MRLEDKVAVVIGSTYGIGKSIACLFAQEGAKVVVSGRTADKGLRVVEEIESGGGRAVYCRCDVGDGQQIKQTMDMAAAQFGGIDILVNNAFALNSLVPMADIAEEEWQKVMDTVLTGTFLGCKYAIPHLIESDGGSIINISSVGGVLGFRLHSAYSAAKAGVNNLTRALALDYGPQNIRANVVCPGIIATPHTQHEVADPGIREKFMQKLAIKRIGESDDIAYAALYLASRESSYVTGTVLMVDGGWSAAGNNEDDAYEF